MATQATAKRSRGRPPMGLSKRPAWLDELRKEALEHIGALSADSSPSDLRKAASAARQVQRAAEWFIRHKTFNRGTHAR
jgi:hypothetical protein